MLTTITARSCQRHLLHAGKMSPIEYRKFRRRAVDLDGITERLNAAIRKRAETLRLLLQMLLPHQTAVRREAAALLHALFLRDVSYRPTKGFKNQQSVKRP